VAQIAREQGILTVGVVTKPFHFEGAHRMRLAENGIQELQQYVDTLIIIPNQNLFRIRTQLVEPLPVQAPTVLCPVTIDYHHGSPPLGNLCTTAIFLCFEADFILHFRGVAGVNRIPHPFLTFVF
jgi:hypothetical protein